MQFKISESALGKLDFVNVQVHLNGDVLKSGYIICFGIKFCPLQHDFLIGWINFSTHVTVLFLVFSEKHTYKSLKVLVSSLFHYVQAHLCVRYVKMPFYRKKKRYRLSSLFSNDRSHTSVNEICQQTETSGSKCAKLLYEHHWPHTHRIWLIIWQKKAST